MNIHTPGYYTFYFVSIIDVVAESNKEVITGLVHSCPQEEVEVEDSWILPKEDKRKGIGSG